MSFYIAPVVFPGTSEKGRQAAALAPDIQSDGYGITTVDWGARQFTRSWQSYVEQEASLIDAETGSRDPEELRRLFVALGERVARHEEEYANTDSREFAEAIRPPMPGDLVELAVNAYEEGLRGQGDVNE